jgi:hypothetical protein
MMVKPPGRGLPQGYIYTFIFIFILLSFLIQIIRVSSLEIRFAAVIVDVESLAHLRYTVDKASR